MKIKIVKSSSIIAVLILCGISFSSFQNGKTIKVDPPAKKYNVLFIAIDDLKPDLGCYGFTETKTPNFDQLAKSSTIFTSTYCQQAVCGPSRASLLTGLRPDKTQIWDLQTLIRDKNPNIVTLPQYFKQNGYHTVGTGKIFDPRSVDKSLDELSWSEPFKRKFKLAEGYEDLAFDSYQNPDIIAKAKAGAKMSSGEEAKSDFKFSSEALDVPDNAYSDGAMTIYAVNELKKLKAGGEPFFFAVGFKKPHLPFVAPKKYWDLYDSSKISLAAWQKPSIDGPEIAYHNSGELRSFIDVMPKSTLEKKSSLLVLEEAKQRELIHGYYACVSYIDAQIGKLVNALKVNGLDQNTIIVIWGDHGWHLGDHSLWCKHSNFEQATRVPLFFYVPGITKGQKYNQPTEFVDIYPTLCELTGIKIPSYMDGKSLVPALKDNSVKIKDYAISQYPRGASNNGAREVMGYSLRNQQYRLTEWVGSFFTTANKFNASLVKDVELYDYKNDPLETRNLAKDPKLKSVVEKLSAQLHDYYNEQFETKGIRSDK